MPSKVEQDEKHFSNFKFQGCPRGPQLRFQTEKIPSWNLRALPILVVLVSPLEGRTNLKISILVKLLRTTYYLELVKEVDFQPLYGDATGCQWRS